MSGLGIVYMNCVMIKDIKQNSNTCQEKFNEYNMFYKVDEQKSNKQFELNQMFYFNYEHKHQKVTIYMNLGENETYLSEVVRIHDLIKKTSGAIYEKKVVFSISFNKNQQYLILEVWINLHEQQSQEELFDNHIMKVRIQEIDKLEYYLKSQEEKNKELNNTKQNEWKIMYFLEIHYLNQSVSIDLQKYLKNWEKYFIDNLEFTYLKNLRERNSINIIFKLKEVLYEKFTQTDDFSPQKNQEVYLTNFEFRNDMPNMNDVKLDLLLIKIEIEHYSNTFIQNFMGTLNINLLQSNFSCRNPILVIENTDEQQKWILKPLVKQQETNREQPKNQYELLFDKIVFWDDKYQFIYQNTFEDLLDQIQTGYDNIEIQVNTNKQDIEMLPIDPQCSFIDIQQQLKVQKDKYKSNFEDNQINQNEVFILTEIPQENISLKLYKDSICNANLICSRKIDLVDLFYDQEMNIKMNNMNSIKIFAQFFVNGQISKLKEHWVSCIKVYQDYHNYTSSIGLNLFDFKYLEDVYRVIQNNSFNQLEFNRKLNTIYLQLEEIINFGEVFDNNFVLFQARNLLRIKGTYQY